jgi:DNA-binding transcriptional LysR family regulator
MASLLREHAEGVGMEMHQIRYFLALCEERSFTRAARQCGISQPSLTNAIIRLEQALGGPLFERKPAVALTMLGHAIHPYIQRIAENADLARGTAEALVNVRLAGTPVEQLVAMPETPAVD